MKQLRRLPEGTKVRIIDGPTGLITRREGHIRQVGKICTIRRSSDREADGHYYYRLKEDPSYLWFVETLLVPVSGFEIESLF